MLNECVLDKCDNTVQNGRKYCSRSCSGKASGPINIMKANQMYKNNPQKRHDVAALGGKVSGLINGPINGPKNIIKANEYLRKHPDIRKKISRAGGLVTGPIIGKNNLIMYSKSEIGRQKARIHGLKIGRWLGINYGQYNIRKAIAAQQCSPSNLENRFFSLIMSHNLPYIFVGDVRRDNIGGRFPDFIHNIKSIVLEVADKHEKEYRKGYSWQTYEFETIQHYSFYNYLCIVLWSDLTDTQIIQKI